MSMKSNLDNGTIFADKYEILALLGSGAVGTVHKANELGLNRLVAIKILHMYSTLQYQDDALKRFRLEAQILNKMSHPNIVNVYRFGLTENNVPFLVMEYFAGSSLRDMLDLEGPLNYKMAATIALKIAEGLQHAHSHNVIHRDLKPENILINIESDDENKTEGESQNKSSQKINVKLIDFGLCKPLSENTKHQTLTGTGELIGSARYMSPEQVLGQQLDERSDVYSFACILFEMIAGRTPFQADSMVQELRARVQESIPLLASLNPNCGVPAELDNLIQRCSTRKPDDRMSDLSEVIEALRIIVAQSTEKRFTHQVIHKSPGTPFKKSLALAAVSIGLLLIAGLCFSSLVSVVQPIRTEEQTISDSTKSVNALIANGQLQAASKLAFETCKTETFKSWAPLQQGEMFYAYFQLFRKNKDQKTAQQFLQNYFTVEMPTRDKSRGAKDKQWSAQIENIEKYLMEETIPRSTWRAIDFALPEVHEQIDLTWLRIGELKEEAKLRRWADPQNTIIEDYSRFMNMLSLIAMGIGQEELFEKFINNGLIRAKRHGFKRVEAQAYAYKASYELKKNNLAEAARHMAKANEILAKIDSSDEYHGLKIGTRAEIFKIDGQLHRALAAQYKKNGNESKANSELALAKISETSSEKIQKEALRTTEEIVKMLPKALN